MCASISIVNTKENIRLRQIIQQISTENIALKKRLQYYENYNSPPSANSLLWNRVKKERKEKRRKDGCEPKKPGRKKGHKGYLTHSNQQKPSNIHWIDAKMWFISHLILPSGL
ncbi:MAG: hypothetical protein QXW73_00290 [Nitrososphaerales archaeon]